MGNEQGQIGFTSFCQMHFVSDPRRASLFAVMSLFVIGRADVTRGWGNILRQTPTNSLIDPLIILYPYLSQNFYCWHKAKPLGGSWIKESIKQFSSLLSDLFSKGFTSCIPKGNARIFAPRTIAFDPFRMTMDTQPVGLDRRKAVEGCTHGFPHTQHPVESADLGQHMGGISPLSSSCLQPAFLPEQGEHFLQQELFCILLYQTSPKFGEHRGVEPRIGEVQAQQIFPIDPSTHRICRLPIRQVLYKLHHVHEGQPPRCFGWLPFLGEQFRKMLIGVDASQDVAHLHGHIAFGISSTCYSGGFPRNGTDRLCFE